MLLKKSRGRLNMKIKTEYLSKSSTNNSWTEKLSHLKFYFYRIFFKATEENEYGPINMGNIGHKGFN